MPTRIRKVRQYRGSRTHGWGQTHAHQGAGTHGGFGRSGGHKHGWTYTVAHELGRYGKHGFHRESLEVTTMNVGELDQLVEKLLLSGKAAKKDEGIFIDLKALGVGKLLGSGEVNRQLVVKVKALSSLAMKKIEEAKGQIQRVE